MIKLNKLAKVRSRTYSASYNWIINYEKLYEKTYFLSICNKYEAPYKIEGWGYYFDSAAQHVQFGLQIRGVFKPFLITTKP